MKESIAIIDTQDMIDSLESILLDREHSEWYIADRFKWSKFAECSKEILLQVFFPIEVLNTFKRDTSHEEEVQQAFQKSGGVYSNDEATSVYSFYYALDLNILQTSTFFHIRFTKSFNDAIRSFIVKADFCGRIRVLLELRKEVEKLSHMFFLSHEMVKNYFEKYCPNLAIVLDNWKAVNELANISVEET